MNNFSVRKIVKGWTEAEHESLFKLQELHGNKWSLIASLIPGKTENLVKNRFYSTRRRNLRRFNSDKAITQCIIPITSKIFEIPEIRKILESKKSVTRNILSKMRLSAKTLEIMNSIRNEAEETVLPVEERKNLEHRNQDDEFDESFYLFK